MRALAGNDNLVHAANVRTVNVTTGVLEYVTGAATVAITVVDAEGDVLTGQAWPLVLTYIAGSQGGFLGVLRNELAWAPGEQWYGLMTVDAGPDQYGAWREPIDVVERTA